MEILSIETSCDDTCIAIIKASEKKKPNFEILSNIVSSQIKIHKKYGGVYPTLAKREHQRNLVFVLKKSLKEAGMLQNSKFQIPNYNKSVNTKFQKLEKILEKEPHLLKHLIKFLGKYQRPKTDAIAVTVGPGLDPCLWVGVNFAKALSYFWNLPIIPVNHIEAHILVNWLSPVGENYKLQITNYKQIKFPAVCLVVSGGHTQLILMEKIGKYKILGETRDDAAGECFDKVARILGLEYPGGPAITAKAAKLSITSHARKANARRDSIKSQFSIKLPRPMIYQKNYDFSFSGLKTAVLYDFKNRPAKIRKSEEYIQEMATEIQQAIIDVLIKKTIKAAEEYKAKSIILGGGVTANKELRKQFEEKIKKEIPHSSFCIPHSSFSTDNAAMAGIAGYFNRKKIKDWQKIKADPNLKI